jgi:hypothetical protein
MGMQLLETPSPVPLDQWTHMAMSFDGTAKRLYINAGLFRWKKDLNTIQ